MTRSIKQCKSGDRCEPITLREALHCQVHHSEMRADEIARRLDISYDTLMQGVSPRDIASLLAARHHEKLLALTPDNHAVLSFYARTQEAVVFRVPQDSVIAQTATMCREFGDVLTAMGDALADDKVTSEEYTRAEREGNELISAVAAMLADMKRRVPRPVSMESRRA